MVSTFVNFCRLSWNKYLCLQHKLFVTLRLPQRRDGHQLFSCAFLACLPFPQRPFPTVIVKGEVSRDRAPQSADGGRCRVDSVSD